VFLPEGEIVRTVGQVLGIVVAESLESAELGARVVNVLYKESTEKIIVTIEDAIEVGSFYEIFRHSMERGDGPILDGLQVQEETIGEVRKNISIWRRTALWLFPPSRTPILLCMRLLKLPQRPTCSVPLQRVPQRLKLSFA
jgi:hypothetical protein